MRTIVDVDHLLSSVALSNHRTTGMPTDFRISSRTRNTGTVGEPEGPIVTRVRRIRPDGRTSRMPGLDLGPPRSSFVTPEGLAMIAFDGTDGAAELVTRR